MKYAQEYTYSKLSAKSVSQLVGSNYTLRGLIQSKFYVLGLHDNYLVESESGKYILRIYRNDWRSQEEALFELKLLSYLQDQNAPVAGPVRTKSSELMFRIASPEGDRYAALFNYAEGHAPSDAISMSECESLGRAVALVHKKTESFESVYKRPVLDLAYLLDESISAIEPFIDFQGLSVLSELQIILNRLLPGLPKEPGFYGICIGDVNPRNFHVRGDNHITIFDFDQCGYGFRAFEIGKFSSSLHNNKLKLDLVNSFMEGYQQVRRLTAEELATIPYFEIVAIIWVMAIHANNADRIGYKLLERPFWDRQIAILKELKTQQSV